MLKASELQLVKAEALLVVDVQVGFVTGVDAVPHSRKMLAAISTLIERARVAQALIIFLQNDGASGATDEPGQAGWRLYFSPESDDFVIRKEEDDGFVGTTLNDCLSAAGVQSLAICGMLSEMCLAATARSAIASGYTVILPHDAHTTYDVPPGPGNSEGVPAHLAARAAEWSLGDEVIILGSAREVVFSD